MISSGKQVFMYFIEKQVDPSTFDSEQYSKVSNFKNKYSTNSKGIYWTIKDENEFKKQLTNHLGLHFLPLIVKPNHNLTTKNLPKLEIAIDKSGSKRYKNLSSYSLISTIENNILKKIDSINDLHIPFIEVKTIEEHNLDENSYEESYEEINDLIDKLKLSKFNKFTNLEYQEVKIDDDTMQSIINYCSKKSITLKDGFWNLGNLKKVKKDTITFSIYSNSNSDNLEGTEDEKQKYKLLKELAFDIHKYNDYIKYFTTINSYSYFSLYIKNIGTTFDEDIDISIAVPKQCLIKNNEIPIPGIACIEDINKCKLVNAIFCSSPNANIERYSDYPIQQFIPNPLPTILIGSSYEQEKEKYLDDIKEIFCYKYYEEEYNDIIKFNLGYLKQNKNMYFPSILFFKYQPEYIKYEITSKYYPKVIKGNVV